MQLVKQISIDTPLKSILADPEVSPSKKMEGFLAMTGSNFTKLAAHLELDRIVLSRIINGRFDNPDLLREYRQRVVDGLGWPMELLWPENGSGASS